MSVSRARHLAFVLGTNSAVTPAPALQDAWRGHCREFDLGGLARRMRNRRRSAGEPPRSTARPGDDKRTSGSGERPTIPHGTSLAAETPLFSLTRKACLWQIICVQLVTTWFPVSCSVPNLGLLRSCVASQPAETRSRIVRTHALYGLRPPQLVPRSPNPALEAYMVTSAAVEREHYLNASYGVKSWLLTKDHSGMHCFIWERSPVILFGWHFRDSYSHQTADSSRRSDLF